MSSTHRLAELSEHGSVIVRAPDSLLVSAAPGEAWFADDEAPDVKVQHPAVTRWLGSVVVAPTIDVDELDLEDRMTILFAALDAYAVAAEWAADPVTHSVG